MNEIKVQVLFSGVLNEKQLAMEIMGALRIADPECITAIAPINEWDDYWKKRCDLVERLWYSLNPVGYFDKATYQEWLKLKSNPPSK